MRSLAAEEGRPCRLIGVPWQLVYWLLRAAEILRLHPPFRADSLLGLVHTAPALSGIDQLAELGITLHSFALDSRTGHLALKNVIPVFILPAIAADGSPADRARGRRPRTLGISVR